MSAIDWRERLLDQMPPDLAEEIDIFEGQMELRRQGKIEDRVFAETRLRRGVYGQRYDNGQRHDGIAQRQLVFPAGELTKGPETLWDAPGMVRIKIPYGGITPDQLEVIAELAEEYSDSILHVTTRQDIQLHYVHIDDTPDLMRRLAAVDITTREACGNGVRNVTACPLAGVCHTEAFDITAYAAALFRFLLGHPDCQDFGRKFKLAFSGCAGEACGLVMMHDFGAIARTTVVDGVERAVLRPLRRRRPRHDAAPGQAALRGPPGRGAAAGRAGDRPRLRPPGREGEPQPRAHQVPGREARHRRVPPPGGRGARDPPARRALDLVPALGRGLHRVPHPGVGPAPARRRRDRPRATRDWLRTNVYRQRQPGFAVATIALPLGDLSSVQTRQLADVARTLRRRRGAHHGRAEHRAALGARGRPAGALRRAGRDRPRRRRAPARSSTSPRAPAPTPASSASPRRAASPASCARASPRRQFELDEAVRGLRIKVSGCFNSCGQHHVADIGFFGNSRKINGVTVPHFQVVLGGRWRENAGSYGLAIGAVPSKRIPEVVDAITTRFVAEREEGESFQDWIARLGKKELGALIGELKTIPSPEEDPTLYIDWGDARVFTMGDIGIGECAGEVISSTDLELSFAESIAFDAQVALEDGDLARADERAYAAMLAGARALVRTEFPNVPDDPDTIVREFKTRFYDTERFFDRFAKGRFARPLFDRHEAAPQVHEAEATRGLVEEAQLFIDAVHAFEIREAGAQSALV